MEIVWSKVVAISCMDNVVTVIVFDGGARIETFVPYADLIKQMQAAQAKAMPPAVPTPNARADEALRHQEVVFRNTEAFAEAFAEGYLDEGRNWKRALDKLTVERDLAIARAERLEVALRMYGRHLRDDGDVIHDSCLVLKGRDNCTCGLDAAIAKQNP